MSEQKIQVKLADYKGVNVQKRPVTVTEQEVLAELERARSSASVTKEKEDGQAAMGDQIVIDFVGYIDDQPFEGGDGTEYPLVLGSNTFIPGFEDQVVGMNVGEERDISVKFPEDYHAEDLKGKDAVFHIVLHEIKKKELPEITDEFIKDADGAESVEAYKAETKKRMERFST